MTRITIVLTRNEVIALIVALLLVIVFLSAWVVMIDRNDKNLMQQYDDQQADEVCRSKGKGRALIVPGTPRRYLCASGAIV